MLVSKKSSHNFPIFVPMNYSGKLTSKVVIKDDYVRTDGTCALYLQVFISKQKKKFPLDIAVNPIHFDKIRQRVKSGCKEYKDHNLIIEKLLADINKIEVHYKLTNMVLTIDKLVDEVRNPASRMDFIVFWESEMVRQKEILKTGTYRQQISMLNKLKAYRGELYFYDITDDFLVELKAHFKNKLKNTPPTINTFVKSFKKYLHIANRKGIITPLEHEDIKLKQFSSDRVFLLPEEIAKLNKFWHSEYINATHKIILAKFLFCCFTGIRFTDMEHLTNDNFVDDTLVFVAEKTGKFQRISLNKSALSFVSDRTILNVQFTNEYINRELKKITLLLKIRKNVTFHVSRHTFATNFLLSGGRLEHLQKLLGHSNIRETLVYVHIVESITDQQIHNMDDILKK